MPVVAAGMAQIAALAAKRWNKCFAALIKKRPHFATLCNSI